MGKKGGNKASGKNSQEKSKGMFDKFFKRKQAITEIRKIIPIVEPEVLKKVDLGIHAKEVETELRLWLSDGRVIKTIGELSAAVKTMKDSAFKQHVTRKKNEFSDWINEIAGQRELAKEINKAKTRKETAKVLGQFVEKSKAKLLPAAEKLIEEKELPAPKNLEEVLAIKKAKEEEKPKVIIQDELRLEEMRLLEEEAALNREEETLNAKRLELSNRRYEVVKRRGDLERKRFQRFLKAYKSKEIPEVTAYPESKAYALQTKDQIISMIEQTKKLVKEGKLEEAKGTFSEIKSSFDRGIISSEERKKIEYDILGLETDIKLAALG